jgi:ABC-type uncharacterized transport system substrate-binding protein
MRRREFVALVGSAAAGWPLTARAQESDRMRRVGVLIVPSQDDPQSRARVTALQQGLSELGWMVGRNLQIDYRFGISDDKPARAAAADLLRLGLDVVIANSPPAVRAVQAADNTIPIVFVAVSEPVALGLLRASRVQAAIPPGSRMRSRASGENGWSCLRRLPRKSRAQHSSSVRPVGRPAQCSSAQLSKLRGKSR